MLNIPHSSLLFHSETEKALSEGKPVLALESTILAHGMPYPENMTFALRAEAVVRESGVVPATIGILAGNIHVGLDRDQLLRMCRGKNIQKVALRDLSHTLFRNQIGATTVSATLAIARAAGISVFATGGIGGVHRNLWQTWDISQDIRALSEYPLVVISAGAKAILDLPNTLEALETAGVPVLGYKTTTFPSFYSRSSSLFVPFSVKSAAEVADWYITHLKTGSQTALLVANPVPRRDEIPAKKMNPIITEAITAAEANGVNGKELTPFLLQAIVDKTKGQALRTNIALALNNIRLGCEVAKEIGIRRGTSDQGKI